MKVLLFLSLTLAAVQATQVSGSNVADLAKRLCKHPSDALGDVTSVSGMLELIHYFDSSLPANDECRGKWIESMQALKEVLSTGNDNACSDEKITLLEEFNHRYVSTSSKDKHIQKKEKLKAPKVLRVFFAHYANAVSTACKGSLLESLSKSAPRFETENGELVDTSSLESRVYDFLQTNGLNPSKNGYEDLVLPWNLVDNYHVSGFGKRLLPKALDMSRATKTNLPVRMSARMPRTDYITAAQRLCLHHLKPSYSMQVLPVLRLINMGLYEDNEPLEKLLTSDRDVQRLFEITLLCESTLPIEAFQDESVGEGKVAVLTPERAADLRKSQPSFQSTEVEVAARSLPAGQAPSITGLDVIGTLADSATAKHLTKVLKSNRIKQEAVIKRVMKMAKEIVKSKVGMTFDQFYKTIRPDGEDENGLACRPSGMARRKREVCVPALIGTVVTILVLFVIAVIWASRGGGLKSWEKN